MYLSNSQTILTTFNITIYNYERENVLVCENCGNEFDYYSFNVGNIDYNYVAANGITYSQFIISYITPNTFTLQTNNGNYLRSQTDLGTIFSAASMIDIIDITTTW